MYTNENRAHTNAYLISHRFSFDNTLKPFATFEEQEFVVNLSDLLHTHY